MSAFYATIVLLIVAGAGCSRSRSQTDGPLKVGWHYHMDRDKKHLPEAIQEDYKSYIQQLPSAERDVIVDYDIRVYHSDAAELALRMEIPVHGHYRVHVLIYDKNNRRAKTFQYEGNRYQS